MYPEDDVARNIRNEQMADAMPSKEEAKAEHRNYLRREGCAECDEDDPDKLDTRYIVEPSCRARQSPPDPTVVLCDECYEQRPSLREQALERAHDLNERFENHDQPTARGSSNEGRVVAVAFYDCENWNVVRQPLIDDGTGERYPHPHAPPTAAIECRCGAGIDEVVRLSEVSD